MSEKPILFSGPMVRAILDDRKSMTRRIVSALAGKGRVTEFGTSDTPGYDWHFRDKAMRWHDISHARLLDLCPYQVGDVLWIRETWGYDWYDDGQSRAWKRVVYRADPGAQPLDQGEPTGWRPSIFMPRSACRLRLRVKGVRVERLQEISPADAIAEGVFCDPHMYHIDGVNPYPVATFSKLWDSLNEKRGYGWSVNPWVWVYTFERVQ